ncbi:MAG TPA: hypothetical protein VGV17_04550 [Bosea sp. (in: a-proteobacteria)]|jgi:hypothetical protein|uniref:hypothetical protein n=1 Tax=Bosea sp. (in: a-proteobacteria) TaxID=1871050 RepID=UPI002DDD9C41|nr:hypothetical protein [Bosea sp. (in: a-proteobacteria)]HEV2553016.1 hypothetical protein [Bosea sp. (in: a-proteobacteria)]
MVDVASLSGKRLHNGTAAYPMSKSAMVAQSHAVLSTAIAFKLDVWFAMHDDQRINGSTRQPAGATGLRSIGGRPTKLDKLRLKALHMPT